MIRCAQCKIEIPNCHPDWGYKLGAKMFFCTYGCMRTKQEDMDRKRSETMKRKAAEKAAKKNKKEDVSIMENAAEYPVGHQDTATQPMSPDASAITPEATSDSVVLVLDKEEATYLTRMVEARLMEIIPDGYGMEWLIDMVDLVKKLRKR